MLLSDKEVEEIKKAAEDAAGTIRALRARIKGLKARIELLEKRLKERS